MSNYTVDGDCEDQALCPTKVCTICRPDFDANDRPIHAPLVKRGRYWCCSNCGSSYGVEPHPDLRAEIANVICMAPMLLRALKQMIETHGKPHREEWMNEAAFDHATKVDAFARLVIAKAEGVNESASEDGKQ